MTAKVLDRYEDKNSGVPDQSLTIERPGLAVFGFSFVGLTYTRFSLVGLLVGVE